MGEDFNSMLRGRFGLSASSWAISRNERPDLSPRPLSFCPVYIKPGHGWIAAAQFIFPSPPNTTSLLDASMNTSAAQYNTALRNSIGLWLDPFISGPPELHDSRLAEARLFTSKIDEAVPAGTIYSDAHLPNCLASNNISFYALRLSKTGRSSESMNNLISSLDPNRRICYWKSWQTQHVDGECSAATPWGGPQSPISHTCALAGVTRHKVVEAIKRKTQDLCPGFDEADMIGSNDRCFEELMRGNTCTKTVVSFMVTIVLLWFIV